MLKVERLFADSAPAVMDVGSLVYAYNLIYT